MSQNKIRILIDSGAFSVWKLGKRIELSAYCAFLEKNADWIDAYINLDFINPADPEEAAALSFKNWQGMRERGLAPIPVFHAKEHLKWLIKYLDAGAPYICLAPLSLQQSGEFDKWYDSVWNYLVNKQALPAVKVHALGEGRIASVLRYPWFSVDNNSWAYRAGKVGDMRVIDGTSVSWNRTGTSSHSAKHISQLGDEETALFNAYIEKHNLNLAAAGDDPALQRAARFYLEALHYKHLEETTVTQKPRTFAPSALSPVPVRIGKGITIKRTKIYLVIAVDPASWAALAYSEYPQALFSYFYLQTEKPCQQLKHFLKDPKDAVNTYPTWGKYVSIYQKTTP